MDRPIVAKYLDEASEASSEKGTQEVEECPYSVLGLEKDAPASKVKI